jgi:uncharacterized protein YutE (UPF0331/DUF86 family)
VSLDPDVVRSRCAEIEESVARLEAFQAMPLDQFLMDRDAQDIACYRLLISIEASLALCYHTTAKRLHQTPDDNAACFDLLHTAGLIDAALAERLRHMARFRNLLVHMYWKVDYERVHDIIQHSLEDLRRFSQAIAQLL